MPWDWDPARHNEGCGTKANLPCCDPSLFLGQNLMLRGGGDGPIAEFILTVI